MEKQKQLKKIFYIGVIVFAIGVIITSMGYEIADPLSPYQSGANTYVFPFFNYISIAGIVIAVIALFISKRKRGKKHE
jgi:multisubunit Na+/H+ antiporter MnhC subunit